MVMSFVQACNDLVRRIDALTASMQASESTKRTQIPIEITLTYMDAHSPNNHQKFGGDCKKDEIISANENKWQYFRKSDLLIYKKTAVVTMTLDNDKCIESIQTENNHIFVIRPGCTKLPINLLIDGGGFFVLLGDALTFYRDLEDTSSVYEYNLNFTPPSPNMRAHDQTHTSAETVHYPDSIRGSERAHEKETGSY